MIRYIILFITTLNLFANNEVDLFNLEKEKKGLIISYSERISIAKEENSEARVALLNQTLNCLKASMSKRDILDCKANERKRILDLIKG